MMENFLNNNYLTNKIISYCKGAYYHYTERKKLEEARKNNPRHFDNKLPLVSVICPTYNRCDILEDRALRSVMKQTYSNIEFIIVGDCCTDNTIKMIEKYKESNKLLMRKKVIREVNLPYRGKRYPETRDNHWFAGPVVPNNYGLFLAKGQWIAKIDDDDIWTEDHVQKLISFAIRNKYEFVSSAYLEERYSEQKIIHPPDGYVGGASSWLYASYLKFFKYNIDCWRKSDRRVNDLDLSYRMMDAGVNMGYLNDITYYYLPRPGEKTVGSEVYRKSEGILEHYKFQK
jgi:glycosyltransferase involved in cell wall biosynthesis